MITAKVKNVGGIQKVKYTVYSDQGTPSVFFDGQYVGTVSAGKLDVMYKKSTTAIAVTLTNITVPPTSTTTESNNENKQLNVLFYPVGQYGGWTNIDGYVYVDLGSNTGIITHKVSGDSASVTSLYRYDVVTSRTTTTYAGRTAGTIPVGSYAITLNYYVSGESTETLSSVSSGALTGVDTIVYSSGVEQSDIAAGGNTYRHIAATGGTYRHISIQFSNGDRVGIQLRK